MSLQINYITINLKLYAYKLKVQTKLTPCNKLTGTGIFCNCGIAIRAASDIYVINRCPEDKLFFGFKHCVDDVLDVKKQDDFNYIVSVN